MSHSKLRQKQYSEEATNNWAISYGDMITLLLAFFVIFFNVKSESMSLKLIKSEIDRAFQSKVQESAGAGVDPTSQRKVASHKLPIVSSEIQNLAKLKANLVGERLLIEFPGVSFFTSGSDRLTEAGKDVLTDFTKILAAHKGIFRMIVRGYTDGVPLKNHRKYKDNLELSAFRSLSAIRFLNSSGLPLSMMRIAGYGEANLLGDRKTQWARKVVLVLEPLDHTEKAAQIENSPAGSKAIEDASAIEIPSHEKRSPASESFDWSRPFKEGKASLSKMDSKVFQKWTKVSDKIEQSLFYQTILKEKLFRDLKAQGYGDREALEISGKIVSQKGDEQ